MLNFWLLLTEFRSDTFRILQSILNKDHQYIFALTKKKQIIDVGIMSKYVFNPLCLAFFLAYIQIHTKCCFCQIIKPQDPFFTINKYIYLEYRYGEAPTFLEFI